MNLVLSEPVIIWGILGFVVCGLTWVAWEAWKQRQARVAEDQMTDRLCKMLDTDLGTGTEAAFPRGGE